MMSNKILWIEDDEEFLKVTIDLMEGRGFVVDGATRGHEGIEKLKKNYFDYSLVLLDLDMPDFSGIETYKEIRKINSQIPVIVVSAHLDEDVWQAKLNMLNERLPEIAKPFPMITSAHFSNIMDTIRFERNKYNQELINPFKYSFEEFKKLSDEKKDKLFKVASEINFSFVEEYFQLHPTDDWIVIAKAPKYVIAHGKSDEEPYEEDLLEMAAQIDCPVFTYSRPVVIEQVDTNWSKTKISNFYYPTLTFEFMSKQKKPQIIKADFDTGNPFNFISYEQLLDCGIIDRSIMSIIPSAQLWGKKYSYYRKNLKCFLIGRSEKRIEVSIKARIVKNWKHSPQTSHYNRIAYVGSSLLNDNDVILVLDAKNKETDIIIEQ